MWSSIAGQVWTQRCGDYGLKLFGKHSPKKTKYFIENKQKNRFRPQQFIYSRWHNPFGSTKFNDGWCKKFYDGMWNRRNSTFSSWRCKNLYAERLYERLSWPISSIIQDRNNRWDRIWRLFKLYLRKIKKFFKLSYIIFEFN